MMEGIALHCEGIGIGSRVSFLFYMALLCELVSF